MNSLDIQKWKIKYIHQINESEEDDFNITPDKQWNAEELTVNNIITPDMWHPNRDRIGSDDRTFSFKIEWMIFNSNDNDYVVKLVGENGGIIVGNLNDINKDLKSEYIIIPPKDK